jgi:anti-sigma factor ChrR (cupin superfamily)
MQKLMNAIMLSCRKATGLVEKRRHCRLESMESIQLKVHLSMCRNCSNYAKQTSLIDRLLNRRPNSLPSTANTSLLEERIIIGIQNKF